jgi:hypothetical protein
MSSRPLNERDDDWVRQDLDRGRYGKRVEGTRSGTPCPAWCQGPGRPEQSCSRCRGIASKPRAHTTWGVAARAKPKETYIDQLRERGAVDVPAGESKQAEGWRHRLKEEEDLHAQWSALQEELNGGE